MDTEAPKAIQLRDYRPPSHLIDTVHLDVSLHPTATRVKATLRMRPNPAAKAARRTLTLDGDRLVLESLHCDGKPVPQRQYTCGPDQLTLKGLPDRAFTLDIVTRIDPDANTALSGLYRSRGIYCTQCEAQGFRRITYFLDRPDVLAVYTTRIEADPADAAVLLANGNPRERGTLKGGTRHYAVWHDPHPKPCYLFALVGGNLVPSASTFRTMSGRMVDLAIYVEPGKESRCAWAMDCLKRSMRWDEERFGREYDLDVFNIVAVSDFNMGAMENKGLNIFNDRLVLATPETATDRNFADIERVIAHEYFHNWSGNRVTCRDWFQLCLKEGLTVYRDQEFSADMRSVAVQRIQEVRQLKARQFPEDAGPLAHPVRPDHYIEINNFYTATVYDKGAELVRMLETLLGRQKFREGLDLYFARHDGEAANVEQFIACFAEVSKRDLAQFTIWYGQAGTPTLVCHLKHDARTKTVDLTIEQVLPPTPGQPKKKPLHMPLRLGFLGHNGHDMPLSLATGATVDGGVVELTRRSQTFHFVDVPSRPVPSINRGFSAPVNLTLALSDGDLAFLMAHDSDPFNRWQAAQDYATRILVDSVKAYRAKRRSPRPTAFIEAMRATALDRSLDPAFRAQMLTLPGELDLAQAIARDVDPAAIHRAVRALARTLAEALGDDLERLYAAAATKAAYEPTGPQAGLRALGNTALALLCERGGSEDIQRLKRHFDRARNATDEIAALALYANQRGPERTAAFRRFHDRWSGDHLVIDHWFSFQASSAQSGTLAAVKRLTRDPLFSLRNPNKVRALIGTFATANPVNFNRPDGKGYRFVADIVRELDAVNPQVAARLLGAFRSWRALEPNRRAEARAALAELAGTKPLSRDVFEIAGKILA